MCIGARVGAGFAGLKKLVIPMSARLKGKRHLTVASPREKHERRTSPPGGAFSLGYERFFLSKKAMVNSQINVYNGFVLK